MTPEQDLLVRDVDALGRMLGEVLREQEGESGFALVEEYRAKTKALRAVEGGWPHDFGPEGEALLARTEALDLEHRRLLVRAFTAYFHLVNMAEERHRLRVLRQRERQAAEAIGGGRTRSRSRKPSPSPPAPASPPRSLRERLAGRASSSPCSPPIPRKRGGAPFSTSCGAWPASPRRSTTRAVPPERRAELQDGIREEITALWLSEEVHRRAPAVFDEVNNGLYYFEHSLWEVVPAHLSPTSSAPWSGPIRERRSRCRRSSASAPGSAGTATATRTSPPPSPSTRCSLHRETALGLYEDDLERLQRHLSVAADEAALTPRCSRASRRTPPTCPRSRPPPARQFAEEPYRRKVGLHARAPAGGPPPERDAPRGGAGPRRDGRRRSTRSRRAQRLWVAHARAAARRNDARVAYRRADRAPRPTSPHGATRCARRGPGALAGGMLHDVAAPRGGLRLPPGPPRPAPAQPRQRGGPGRAAARGRRRARLPLARRGGAHRGARRASSRTRGRWPRPHAPGRTETAEVLAALPDARAACRRSWARRPATSTSSP